MSTPNSSSSDNNNHQNNNIIIMDTKILINDNTMIIDGADLQQHQHHQLKVDQQQQSCNIMLLPDIIIYHIFRNIPLDIDKICLLLTCKKWFQKRDKILFTSTYNSNKNNYIKDHMNNNNNGNQQQDDDNDDYSYEIEYRLDRLQSFINTPLKNITIAKPLFNLTSFQSSFNNIVNRFHYIDKLDDLKNFSNQYYNKGNHQEEQQEEEDENEIIHTLIIGEEFNEIIPPNLIPPIVDTIYFGKKFDREIQKDVIPEGCKRIVFETNFNRELLPGILPTSLLELRMSYYYKCKFQPGTLPPNLETLILGLEYDRLIECGVLPNSLKVLDIGYYYNMDIIPQSLPSSLIYLEFPYSYKRDITRVMIPESTKHLVLPRAHRSSNESRIMDLPSTIKRLDHYDGDIEQLPPNTHLLELRLAMTTVKPLDLASRFPKLRKLFLGSFKSHIPDGSLPSQLTVLDLGPFYNQNLTYLPPSLTKLYVGGQYSFSIDSKIIPNLVTLDISSPTFQFQQFFTQTDLPASLSTIRFAFTKDILLPMELIPKSVTKVVSQSSYSGNNIHSIPRTVQHFYYRTSKKSVLPFSRLVHFKKLTLNLSYNISDLDCTSTFHIRQLDTDGHYLIVSSNQLLGGIVYVDHQLLQQDFIEFYDQTITTQLFNQLQIQNPRKCLMAGNKVTRY